MSTFAADETGSAAKFNQKTLLVDTGANIAAATTYAGMMAFCTSTGSGFTAGVFYERNVANSAWVAVYFLGGAAPGFVYVDTGANLAALSATFAGMVCYCTSTGSGFTAGVWYVRNAANSGWSSMDTLENIVTGDLLYGSAADTVARLAIGGSANILKVASGKPAWASTFAGLADSDTGEKLAHKDAASGYPSLDSNVRVPQTEVGRLTQRLTSDYTVTSSFASIGLNVPLAANTNYMFEATLFVLVPPNNSGASIDFAIESLAAGASLVFCSGIWYSYYGGSVIGGSNANAGVGVGIFPIASNPSSGTVIVTVKLWGLITVGSTATALKIDSKLSASSWTVKAGSFVAVDVVA